MSDDSSRTSDSDAEGPRPIVIPDGGLGTGLPDWMQEKPIWRAPEAVDQVVTTASGTIRSIPAPDTSVIDLTSILVASDLPTWLQSITALRPEPGMSPLNDRPIPDASGSLIAPLPGSILPKVVSVGPDDAHLDLAPDRPESNDQPAIGNPPQRPSSPWWATDRIFGLLMVAIAVTLILVALRLTGVL